MDWLRRLASRRAILYAWLPAAAFVAAFALVAAVWGEEGDRGAPAGDSPAPAPAEEAPLTGDGRIVLTLFTGGTESVEGYLASVAPDGSDVRAITERPGGAALASDVAPALSPDGATVAFQRAVPGEEPRIYLVGLDGGGLRPLTGQGGAELDPAWSPDGSSIAFARSFRGSFDLFVCAPDGSGLTALTATRPADEDFPSWSPDGTQLAFTRYVTGFESSGGDLWIMEPDGSGERLLLGGPDDDAEPSWSPDGTRIAFVRNGRVSVMDADGSGIVALTAGAIDPEFRPRWSPDGTRILFTRDRGSSSPSRSTGPAWSAWRSTAARTVRSGPPPAERSRLGAGRARRRRPPAGLAAPRAPRSHPRRSRPRGARRSGRAAGS